MYLCILHKQLTCACATHQWAVPFAQHVVCTSSIILCMYSIPACVMFHACITPLHSTHLWGILYVWHRYCWTAACIWTSVPAECTIRLTWRSPPPISNKHKNPFMLQSNPLQCILNKHNICLSAYCETSDSMVLFHLFINIREWLETAPDSRSKINK